MLNAFQVLFPKPLLSKYIPSVPPPLFDSDTQEHVDDDVARATYLWNSKTREAHWKLSPELQYLSPSNPVHMLGVPSDEGSTLWSLFQFMATGCKIRAMWHRDPLHKLSNVFARSVRAVAQAFQTVMAVLVVHRFRRAPFGGCRFWQDKIMPNHLSRGTLPRLAGATFGLLLRRVQGLLWRMWFGVVYRSV
jgi:hypothetical protein